LLVTAGWAVSSALATVPGLNPDTEDSLIGEQQWQAIHERRAAGQGVSKIARELELDRKTVRSSLRQSCWKPYRRQVSAPTVLDAHRQWLSERAPQVHYSARILHQELRGQHGCSASYETVKLAVRPLRAAASVAALTQRRFETAPGEQAQVDWGQMTVSLGGAPAKVHVLIMTLGYSRRGYAEGFLHERMPNLLGAHENAFAHFGGRCETLLYDRMRTVVLGTTADATGARRPRFNTTFEAFARHWGFTPRLCQAYRAQTKGKVESGVKYVKRNFAPGRTFSDLEDFNVQLFAWQGEIADVRIHGTTHQRPIDRFPEEARALVPTAGQASFLQATVRERVVAGDWLISIENNRYSVPFALIGKTVRVVREGASWVVRYRGLVVAEHAVLAGRAQLSVRPEHGPGAAARNARKRYAEPGEAERRTDTGREVEVRDLAVYEQLLGSELEVA
jgi:transposase